jgi:hypothetical protein
VKKCSKKSITQCGFGECADIMCLTHTIKICTNYVKCTIKICFDCKIAPYTNQITFANKLPNRRRTT